MLAAILLRVPTLAYEPNAVPGMTNRLAGTMGERGGGELCADDEVFPQREVTGVPVRPEIFALPAAACWQTAPQTAGDGGQPMARVIFNETMPKIAAELLAAVPGLTIVHQAGARQRGGDAGRHTRRAGPSRRAGRWRRFWTTCRRSMPPRTWCWRGAGSTVAELCAAGKPSLLVPFAAAADDHQRKNAEVLVQAGAAVMLLERDATPTALLEGLGGLLRDSKRRAEMAENARRLARAGALERIAEMVIQLAQSGSPAGS